MRISDWSSDVCSSDLVDLSRIQPSGAAGADTEARHTDGAVQVLRDSCAAEAAAGANARGSTVMPNLQNKIAIVTRSEEHTSELQSLMRISYAVFCLIKK